MKLLVTGATGFVGQYVVNEALSRGHEVRAVVRPASNASNLTWENHANVELARVDLRSPKGLSDALRGVDAVLHLAADKGGDLYAQMGGTVVATENLLAAMREADVDRIVLISTFSVYDYQRIATRSTLTEDSPLEAAPETRDAYCQTKLLQERLITESEGLRWTVLRPGVIYGPGHTWTARLGMQLSDSLWVRTGAWAQLPLNYVENCAEAVVLAAECDAAIGRVLNIVDDETPTQRQYLKALQQRMKPRPRVIPVAWIVMKLLVWLASLTSRVLFEGKARVPQIFRKPSLMARCKPLRYDNSAIKQTLGWKPRYSLEQALQRCFDPPKQTDDAPAEQSISQNSPETEAVR